MIEPSFWLYIVIQMSLMEQQGLNGVNQNLHSLAKVPPANDVVYQGIRMNIGVGVIVVF